MSQVFSHGRLRLYLLKLLEEGAKHGYELIRQLEDRFMGLYAPSPGTIYPRLQRLEADGLVTHSKEGGRKVYQITDAGREELRRRTDELASLEADIHQSVHGIAEEIRENVRDSTTNLRTELTQAAREIRQQQRHLNRQGIGRIGANWGEWVDTITSLAGSATTAARGQRTDDTGERHASMVDPRKGLERRLLELLSVVRQIAQRTSVTEAQVREIRMILDDALDRIKETLRRQD